MLYKIKKSKKADVNWQIIALVLALLVLIILLFIFRTKIFGATKTVDDITNCEDLYDDANCVDSKDNCKDGIALTSGCPNDKVCCVPKPT